MSVTQGHEQVERRVISTPTSYTGTHEQLHEVVQTLVAVHHHEATMRRVFVSSLVNNALVNNATAAAGGLARRLLTPVVREVMREQQAERDEHDDVLDYGDLAIRHPDLVERLVEVGREYRSLRETAFLLRSPVNAERLLRSVEDARAGRTEVHDLIEE